LRAREIRDPCAPSNLGVRVKTVIAMLAAVAAISTASAGWADTTPPPAQKPQVLDLAPLSRRPLPIPPTPPSPQKLALARQLMLANGFEDQMKALLASLGGLMGRIVNPAAPSDQRHLMELMQQDAQVEVLNALPTLEMTATYIYATHLTEKEMTDDIAWQTSESGRSIRAKTPTMTRDMTASIVPTIPQLTSKALAQALERVCQQNNCTPEQRQGLNDAVTNMAALQTAGRQAAERQAPFLGPRPTISNPNPMWTQRPAGSDLAQYYPDRAQRLEKEGSATVECRLTATGFVTNCLVVSENPLGYAFGDATIKVARFFHAEPLMRDGKPIESLVTIPIHWTLGRSRPLPLPIPPATQP
jgi:TonB family protein